MLLSHSQAKLLKQYGYYITKHNVPVRYGTRVVSVISTTSSSSTTFLSSTHQQKHHHHHHHLRRRQFSSSTSSSTQQEQQWRLSGRVVSTTTMNKRRLQQQYQPSMSRTTAKPTTSISMTPYMMNGKVIPFHIKDLNTIPQQQQQQQVQQQSSYYHNNGASTAAHSSSSTSSYYDTTSSDSRTTTTTTNDNDDSSSKLTVVLDLDECLVHSRFLYTSLDAAIYTHQLLQQQSQNQLEPNGYHNSNTAFDSFRMVLSNHQQQQQQQQQHGDPIHVHVFIRPGCIEFLSHVVSLYDTYIYTAGTSLYANPILDYLSNAVQIYNNTNTNQNNQNNTTANDSHTKSCIFRGRFYREHCIYDPKTKQYFKDLSLLHLYNTNHNTNTNNSSKSNNITSSINKMVLIDNNPISFVRNPNNGILIESFYGPFHQNSNSNINMNSNLTTSTSISNNTHSSFDTVKQYLHELANVNDVRPIIQSNNMMITNNTATTITDTTSTDMNTIVDTNNLLTTVATTELIPTISTTTTTNLNVTNHNENRHHEQQQEQQENQMLSITL